MHPLCSLIISRKNSPPNTEILNSPPSSLSPSLPAILSARHGLFQDNSFSPSPNLGRSKPNQEKQEEEESNKIM